MLIFISTSPRLFNSPYTLNKTGGKSLIVQIRCFYDFVFLHSPSSDDNIHWREFKYIILTSAAATIYLKWITKIIAISKMFKKYPDTNKKSVRVKKINCIEKKADIERS